MISLLLAFALQSIVTENIRIYQSEPTCCTVGIPAGERDQQTLIQPDGTTLRVETKEQAKQRFHDDIERLAFARLQTLTEVIFEQDHPAKRAVDDYKKARACYTKLHLYKAQNCDAALAKVDADLAAKE